MSPASSCGIAPACGRDDGGGDAAVTMVGGAGARAALPSPGQSRPAPPRPIPSLRGGEADVAIQYGGGRAHGAHQPNGSVWQSAALDRHGLRPRDDGDGVARRAFFGA